MKGTANPSLVIHPVVDCRFVPRPANLGNKSRCDMLKWLVFTPRSGAENDADAAIFVLEPAVDLTYLGRNTPVSNADIRIQIVTLVQVTDKFTVNNRDHSGSIKY